MYAEGGRQGSFLRASEFQVGDAVLAYPEGKAQNEANIVQLIRLKETEFKPPTRLELTDRRLWPTAPSATHLGCIVSWVKSQQVPQPLTPNVFVITASSIRRGGQGHRGAARFRLPRSGSRCPRMEFLSSPAAFQVPSARRFDGGGNGDDLSMV